MVDLTQEIALEEEHILRTLAALQEAQNRSQKTLIELSVLMPLVEQMPAIWAQFRAELVDFSAQN